MTPQAFFILKSLLIIIFMVLVISYLSRCSLYLSRILKELKKSNSQSHLKQAVPGSPNKTTELEAGMIICDWCKNPFPETDKKFMGGNTLCPGCYQSKVPTSFK